MRHLGLQLALVLMVVTFGLPVAVYASPLVAAMLAVPAIKAAVGVGCAALGVLTIIAIALEDDHA